MRLIRIVAGACGLLGLLVACEAEKDLPPPLDPPTAVFTSSGSLFVGDSVRFANASTNASSYAWTFGDGGTSTRQNPAHVYRAPGQYTVQLSATGAGGTAQSTTTLDIRNPVPTASFTYSGTMNAGDSVRFVNTSTNATTYRWTFYNGTNLHGGAIPATSSTRKNPTHLFPSGGTYYATLDVTGPGGSASSNATIRINVIAPVWNTCRCKVFMRQNSGPYVQQPDEGITIQLNPYNGNGFSFKDVTYDFIQDISNYKYYRSTLNAASIGGSASYYPVGDSINVSYHSGGIGGGTYMIYRCKKI